MILLKETYKKIITLSSVYIIGKILQFLTIPIITNYLSIEDFGYIALFELCIAPFYILANFSVDNIIKSNWPLLNIKERGSLIILLFLLAITISLSLIVPLINNPDYIFFNLLNTKWYALRELLPFMILSAVYIIPKEIFNSWSIVENKINLNKNINLFNSILMTFSFFITSIISKDYITVIKALVCSRVLVGIIQTIIIFYHIEKKFITSLNFRLVRQVFPLYIASVLNNITPRFNSFLISIYFNISILAYHNISYSALNFYNELLEHFYNATDSFIYDSKTNTIHKNLVFIYTMWSYLVFILSSFYMLFGNTFINAISNGLFHDSYNFGVLIFAIIMIKLPFLGNQQILIKNGKEKAIMTISIFRAFFIVIFSYALIPILGAKGILISIWTGNLGSDIIIYFLKNKYLKKWMVKMSVICFSVANNLSIFSYFYFRDNDLHNYYSILQLIIITLFCIKKRREIINHVVLIFN